MPHRSSPVRPPSSMRLINRIGSPETSQQPPHETVMAVSVEEDETSKDKAQLPQQEILNTLMSPPERPSSTQSNAPSVHKEKEPEKKKRARMYENTSDEEEDEWGSKTDTSIGVSNGEKEVPGKPIRCIGEPAPYQMARNGINHSTVKGHICVEKPSNWEIKASCYNTVRTPTLCKPDTLDRPCYFLFNLLNLAMPLTTYAVHLVLLIFVLLSSLPCYSYNAILILTSDIPYSLIDMFLSILRYISTHVFVVEP
jgi:hypothetical protein